MYTLPLKVARQQHKFVSCFVYKQRIADLIQYIFKRPVFSSSAIVSAMAANTQSTFWESISESVRNGVEQAVPSNMLEEKLSSSASLGTLESRYTQLEHLLKDMVDQGNQSKQRSEEAASVQSTRNPQILALFPLAMIQCEMKQYAAAEEIYRQLLAMNPPSRPDLAAASNLIDVLNLQHKYAEAQTMSMQVLPLLQKEFGADSPQYLGCMRKLVESLVGQNKSEEARQLYQKGLNLVATINDGDVRKEEDDAMQEMGRRVGALA